MKKPVLIPLVLLLVLTGAVAAWVALRPPAGKQPLVFYGNVDVAILVSLTPRVRAKHSHPGNGIFPLKFRLVQP